MTQNVVGQSVKRYDGLAHVTGETLYVDDIYVPGTLTIKALRSPVVKGKLRNIDISKAERVRGVAGIITHSDVPGNGYGFIPEQPVLAQAIRYKGEPIAAVAAEDEDAAMEALSQIKVDIEEEIGVIDPLEAMKPEAPKVRPEGNLYIFNNRSYRKTHFGNIEEGFKQADYVIENEFFHQAAQHAQMEPQTTLVVPDASGKLTIYSGTQCLHFHLVMLCHILALPTSKLKLVGGTCGGGFGAKNDIHADHIAALLAMKTKRPVKWRWTREEELLYSTVRGTFIMKYKDGVKKDGRIVAREVTSIYDSGAYPTFNPLVMGKHLYISNGPYFIPNFYGTGYLVFTNKVTASSMRGYGITSCNYAAEMQMNKVAGELGIDPWKIRFINAYRKGDKTATQSVLESVAAIEVMQAVAEKAGVELPPELKAMSSLKGREEK